MASTIKVTWGRPHDKRTTEDRGRSGSPPRVPTRGCLSSTPHLCSNDVYIGRMHHLRSGRVLSQSFWANPFKLKDCTDIADCLEKFDAHLRSSATLISKITDLAGKRLVCHCPTHSRCHADVLVNAFVEATSESTAEIGDTRGQFSLAGGGSGRRAAVRHP